MSFISRSDSEFHSEQAHTSYTELLMSMKVDIENTRKAKLRSEKRARFFKSFLPRSKLINAVVRADA